MTNEAVLSTKKKKHLITEKHKRQKKLKNAINTFRCNSGRRITHCGDLDGQKVVSLILTFRDSIKLITFSFNTIPNNDMFNLKSKTNIIYDFLGIARIPDFAAARKTNTLGQTRGFNKCNTNVLAHRGQNFTTTAIAI